MSLTITTAAGRRKPRRAVQLVVWVLFAAVAILGYTVSTASHTNHTAQAPAGVVSTVGHVSADPAACAQNAGQYAVKVGGQTVCGFPNAPAVQSAYGCQQVQQPGQTGADAAKVSCGDSALSLLPAYRWRDATSMPTDLGIGGHAVVYNILTSISNLMFSVAGFLWWLLLVLVEFAISTDMLHSAAASIDAAFNSTVGALGASGIPIILVVGVVIAAVLRYLKGRTSGAFSMVVGAVVVLGVMFGMSAAAAGSGSSNKPNVGSPAWAAIKGNDTLNQFAGAITSGFGMANQVTKPSKSGSATGDADTGGPTCAVYNAELTSTYNAMAAQEGAATGNSASKMTAASLTAVSSMWQRSMYQAWTEGLFGNLGSGARIACHQLETNAKITPVEQYALVGGVNAKGATTHPSAPGYEGMAIGPFMTTGDQATDEAAAFAWAACLGNGKAAPGWQVGFANFNSLVKSGGDLSQVGSQNCKAWWTFLDNGGTYNHGNDHSSWRSWGSFITGNGFKKDYSHWGVNSCDGCNDPTSLEWDDTKSLRKNLTWDGNAPNPQDPHSYKNALNDVYTTVDAYWGNDGGTRMFTGASAIIAAGLYAWAFGAAAAGTLLAQVGLIFLLMLLPFTLMLLALPAGNGGRNKTGVKLFKTTAAFLGSKLIFLILLCSMVQLISVLWAVVDGLTGANTDGAYALWMLVVPLAAIFIMKMLVKALGLGNIMSIGGAAGFATKAALQSTPDGKRLARGISKAAAGSPLARSSARAKNTLKGAPGKAFRAAKAGTTAAAALNQANKGQLSPQLAREVAAGRLSLTQAHALQSGMLHPSLLGAVRSGNMSLAAAIARTSAMKSADGIAHKRDVAGVGGYGAAMDRTRTVAGATSGATGLAAAGPVFTDPKLTAGADGTALKAAQVAANAIVDEKGKGLPAGEYEMVATAKVAANLESLRAGVQGVDVGDGRSLTAGEVLLEKARFAETNGIAEHQVLLGDSGAPALLAKVPRGARGALQFDLSGSEDQLVAQACNMANYLRLDVPSGASESQVHLQTVLTMQALGGISDTGQLSYDFIKEKTGMDPATASGREAIIEAMRDTTGRSELNRISIELPYAERQAITKLVYDQYPSTLTSGDMTVVNRTVEVQSLASGAAEGSRVLSEALKEATTRTAKMDPSSPDFNVHVNRTLRILNEVPDTFANLGAVTMEARTTRGLVEAGKVDLQLADSLARAGQQAAEELQAELARLEVATKTASPELQGAMLKQICKVVEEKLEAAAAELGDGVRDMMREAQNDEQKQVRALASQIRGPARSADLSGGAVGLPSD